MAEASCIPTSKLILCVAVNFVPPLLGLCVTTFSQADKASPCELQLLFLHSAQMRAFRGGMSVIAR